MSNRKQQIQYLKEIASGKIPRGEISPVIVATLNDEEREQLINHYKARGVDMLVFLPPKGREIEEIC